MRTSLSVVLAVVVLLTGAGAAMGAEVEPARVEPAEPVSAGAVTQDAQAQPAERIPAGEWAAEREEIERLRSEASDRIAEIEARLESEDLIAAERVSLHRQVGDIKLETEIRVQEIRLSVAESRGMTRHAEEIRKALDSLRGLDAEEETGVIDRPESAPAPGEIIEPDQG